MSTRAIASDLKALKRGDVVELHWVDSIGRSSWMEHDELEKWGHDVAGSLHRTCGYFFHLTDLVVLVVQSMVEYDPGASPMAASPMGIPVCAVRRVTLIR